MYTQVSEAIKSARKTQGLSTRELAHVLGVSQNMISLWENGAEPSQDTLSRLLRCDTPWVRELALDIYSIRQRNLLRDSLPEIAEGAKHIC